jgi:hypothetical protein
MAVTTTILRNSLKEVFVKFSGDGESDPLDISAHLLTPKEKLDPNNPVIVNIVNIVWAGRPANYVEVVRDGNIIITLTTDGPAVLPFGSANDMYPESSFNDKNITVIHTGICQCWLTLHKVSGFVATVETAQFGVYDDPTQAGQ